VQRSAGGDRWGRAHEPGSIAEPRCWHRTDHDGGSAPPCGYRSWPTVNGSPVRNEHGEQHSHLTASRVRCPLRPERRRGTRGLRAVGAPPLPGAADRWWPLRTRASGGAVGAAVHHRPADAPGDLVGAGAGPIVDVCACGEAAAVGPSHPGRPTLSFVPLGLLLPGRCATRRTPGDPTRTPPMTPTLHRTRSTDREVDLPAR